jgi:hypothetical protein
MAIPEAVKKAASSALNLFLKQQKYSNEINFVSENGPKLISEFNRNQEIDLDYFCKEAKACLLDFQYIRSKSGYTPFKN